MERRATIEGWRVELGRVERQIRGMIEAIKAGMFQPSMKSRDGCARGSKGGADAILGQRRGPSTDSTQFWRNFSGLRSLPTRSAGFERRFGCDQDQATRDGNVELVAGRGFEPLTFRL
jgi:hypothetical protein